jgi:signal transduction histidine kinase
VSFITEDKEGNMWIGTIGAGLNKLDGKTDQFTVYRVADGLPHNIIQGILFDKDENLWISTNNGLSKFNQKQKQFTNYGFSDGLQSAEYTKTSCLKTKDGMMLFGGVNGFNAFYPENIIPNQFIPNVVFTDFKLFSKPIAIGERINKRVILPKSISELKELKLSYNENFISFEFTALDYYCPEKNRYSFKMEGFDDDWRFTDARNRTATYTNLNPGTYTFRVKASNNEGVWNETGAAIKITIFPPWWQTWWFRIISFLTLTSLLVLFFFYRVSALNKQKRILEIMVAERTTQLQNANAELKELNATKDKFVSIIAHDILNPFNSILGFSELLITNFNYWDDDKKLKTVQVIFGSSRRLFDLLENLLAWSRSERGLLTIAPRKFELNEYVKNSISLFKFSASSKAIEIIENSFFEKIFVFSDPNIIHVIIRNLLSNAIKFTQTGGAVKIELKVVDNFAVVSVIDNGVGIPGENIDDLFKLNVPHTTMGTNEEKGTGLGLILVKDFVEKQGGELSIKSIVGEGSTFLFTIPLALDH